MELREKKKGWWGREIHRVNLENCEVLMETLTRLCEGEIVYVIHVGYLMMATYPIKCHFE